MSEERPDQEQEGLSDEELAGEEATELPARQAMSSIGDVSIPLDPHFRGARQAGAIEAAEYDEGMVFWGLYAAANRVDFLPVRAGLGSDVMKVNPDLRTVVSPYGGDELVAMPALKLDAAIVHLNRADAHGNAEYLGPDLYFDDLFVTAAERAYLSCEEIVP